MDTDARPLRDVTAYAPQLDGVRCLAVSAVAFSHWLPAWQFGLPFGAGVHLFFVLSGFLITRILLALRDADRRGGAVARFYARRTLRLFPAFFVVLGLAAWADVPLVRDTWRWHAAYLSNVFIAREAQWQGHVSHFWSLAVEEQFYLVWPWAIVWAPRAWLAAAIAAAIALGPASRLLAAEWAGLPEPFWALVPGGSADSLGVGAWLAWLAWPSRGVDTPRADLQVARAAQAGLAIWAAIAVGERVAPLPVIAVVLRQLAQAVLFAWVVWRAAAGLRGGSGRLLEHPAVVHLGRISYGIYLIHPFAPVVMYAFAAAVGQHGRIPEPGPVRAIVAAAVTVALAELMWRGVERPILALKRRVPYQEM